MMNLPIEWLAWTGLVITPWKLIGYTGALMFAVQMIINVPSKLHLAHLREEFMEFCDARNLDAILEPVKS